MTTSSKKSKTLRDPLGRLLHALNHPTRRRILTALTSCRGSAKSLAREFEMPKGDVSYHLNKVLYRECGVVEIVDKVKKGKTWENVYIVNAEAFKGLLPWDELPEPIQMPLRSFSVAEFLALAAASIKNGSFGSLSGTRLEWTPAEVDHHGWLEICDAANQFGQRMEAAITRSRKREGRKATPGALLTIVVGFAAFEAAASPFPTPMRRMPGARSQAIKGT